MYSTNTNLETINTTGMNNAIAGFFAIFMIMFFVLILLSLIPNIIRLIGQWKVFTKAGKGGWEVLIPYYNIYTEFKISGVSPWFLLIYLLPIILMPFYFITGFTSGVIEGTTGSPNLFLSVFPDIINILVCLVSLGLSVYSSFKLAIAFGKGVGYTVGLIFVPWIFYPIIGFSKDIKYIGPNGSNQNTTSNNTDNSDSTNTTITTQIPTQNSNANLSIDQTIDEPSISPETVENDFNPIDSKDDNKTD